MADDNNKLMIKKSNLVVYKNELNNISFKKFNPTELDLLFSFLSILRNKDSRKITVPFDKLKELSKYNKETALESFVKDLEKTYAKLLDIQIRIETEDEICRFVLFNEYSIDKNEQKITVGISERYKYFINELNTSFTKFELEEVTSLKSKYSKNLYRLLKQYRNTGIAIFHMDNFKNLLDIPDSYKQFNINQRVLKPALEELKPYFKNLEVEKIKGIGKYKRNIVRIKFTFDREFEDPDEQGYLTFNENGKYYEEHIYNLNKKEVIKKYGKQ